MLSSGRHSRCLQTHRGDLIALGIVLTGLLCALLLKPASTPDLLLFLGKPLASSCGMRNVFGIDCWACGMTRSFAYAIRLRFIEAWHFNPSGLLFFLYMVLQGVYRIWVLAGGRRIAVEVQIVSFLGLIAFMLVHWGLFEVMPLIQTVDAQP